MQDIGLTVECPDEIKVPHSTYDLFTSENYWILSYSTVHHKGREKKVEFDLYDLTVGDIIGCSIHEDGTLHYYVNGKDRGVGWDDKLPVNQAVYGIVDVYGCVTKIRSLFHYGKCSHGYLMIIGCSCDAYCAHICMHVVS